jgi:2-oxoglutarate ferredoxin oxidoreductase subunit beta
MSTAEVAVTTKKDFKSDQEVRWCPGCGDYGILLAGPDRDARTRHRPERRSSSRASAAASRFPYYMNTYGFHTIHGRAPAIATGVPLPDPISTCG